jgi:hypothetical protein
MRIKYSFSVTRRPVFKVALAMAIMTVCMAAYGQSTRDKINKSCPGAAEWERKYPEHVGSKGFLKASNESLSNRLKEMAAQDQAARDLWEKDGFKEDYKNPSAALLKMESVDRNNLSVLKKITNDGGKLPNSMEIGSDGVDALWLLVQHADADTDFQERALGQMKDILDQGFLSGHDYALLVDRVEVARGKNQPYGSQFYRDGDTYRPRPYDSLEAVDKRRADIKIMPLSDYGCGIHIISEMKVSLVPGKPGI